MWTATATEAPSQTEPPNPANQVCLTLTPGEKCYFLDDTTQLDVEGICRTSTVVGFSGLVCEPDGKSETADETVCDSKSVGDACVITKADGAKINGFCEDGGVVRGQLMYLCVHNPCFHVSSFSELARHMAIAPLCLYFFVRDRH